MILKSSGDAPASVSLLSPASNTGCFPTASRSFAQSAGRSIRNSSASAECSVASSLACWQNSCNWSENLRASAIEGSTDGSEGAERWNRSKCNVPRKPVQSNARPPNERRQSSAQRCGCADWTCGAESIQVPARLGARRAWGPSGGLASRLLGDLFLSVIRLEDTFVVQPQRVNRVAERTHFPVVIEIVRQQWRQIICRAEHPWPTDLFVLDRVAEPLENVAGGLHAAVSVVLGAAPAEPFGAQAAVAVLELEGIVLILLDELSGAKIFAVERFAAADASPRRKA